MIKTKLIARLKELSDSKIYFREYVEGTKFVHSRINKSIEIKDMKLYVYDLISGMCMFKTNIDNINNIYAADKIIRIPYIMNKKQFVFSYYE